MGSVPTNFCKNYCEQPDSPGPSLSFLLKYVKWVCNSFQKIALESFKRYCSVLQKSRALEGQIDWKERQRKGQTLTLTLGAARRARGASLHKQVPLVGQTPSELIHLAGKHKCQTPPAPVLYPVICVPAAAAPAQPPLPQGDSDAEVNSHQRWAGLFPLGAGQGAKGCFYAEVLARQRPGCDLVFSVGSPNVLAGLVGRLWLSQQDGLTEKITDDEWPLNSIL